MYRLQKHLTKLKKLPRFQHWNDLGSQVIQDVAERIDRSYRLFFRNRKTGIVSSPPGFRSRRKYRSFTLKQAGWALVGGNRIRIGNTVFRFSKSRDIDGSIKTVTVKRDAQDDFYLFFSCEIEDQPNHRVMTGKSAGVDFGLKTFLTLSDGSEEVAPLFFKDGMKAIRLANRSLSSKKRGSNNRYKARLNLARIHGRVADKRRDYHFKLARKLSCGFDRIFVEDLNLKAMQRLWGRKVGDLGFSEFVSILRHQANKVGAVVYRIDRWFPSSKTCNQCGAIGENLSLKDRTWRCVCGTVHDRDLNASVNILREGASSLGLGDIRPFGAVAV